MIETTRLEAADWDSDGCRTPDPLFLELDAHYRFGVDLFASAENTKKPIFFTKENSAFDREWPRLSETLALRHARRIYEVVIDPKWKTEDSMEIGREAVPAGQDYGWNFGNPPYSTGNLERAVRKAIEQAKRGSGTLYLIPASTGVGWFQTLLFRCCNVLDSYTVDRGAKWKGYEFSMQGIGYRQKILFLSGRVPFDPPLDYPKGRKWSGPAGDSVLVEWRPAL